MRRRISRESLTKAVEDEVTAYLEYPNGATGIFITTTGEAPGTNRFEVVGQNGKLVSENGKLTFTKNAVSTQAAIRGDGEMSHEVRTHPSEPKPFRRTRQRGCGETAAGAQQISGPPSLWGPALGPKHIKLI